MKRRPRAWATAAVGALGGAFAGLTGVGGGAVLVPLMVGVLRLRQHTAHGTSLVVIAASSLAGVLIYGSFERVDWLLAGALLPTALAGAVAGAAFVQRIPAAELRAAFGAFLLVVAARLLVSAGGEGIHLDGAWRLPLVTGAGLAGGFLSGALGVGGGAIFVPTLVLAFGEGQHAAQGVSLAVIVPTAATGSITHWRHGTVDGETAAWLASGAVPGSVAGAAVASSLGADVLQRGFAVVLVIVGTQMLWSGWRAVRTRIRLQRAEGTGNDDTR